MERRSCCLCPSERVLTPVFSVERLPSTFSPTTQPCEEDKFIDAEFGACESCSSVQLMNLVDPKFLYAANHNQTSHSKTWQDHHQALADFISAGLKERCAETVVFEVGGASGDLARKLAHTCRSYTILELAIPPIKTCDVPFVEGNSETFIFPRGCTVILSHVFEHLYNPAVFVENCAAHGVTEVFISFPSMDLLDVVPIHIEHTYYADPDDIVALFSRFSYALAIAIDFRKHSHFYHFVKKASIATIAPRVDAARKDRILMQFQARKEKMSSLVIPENAFISPAGPYGQMLHYYAKCPIQGFLDNDVTKQHQRVYGTPYYALPFSVLEGKGAVPVFLHAGPYSAELIAQIQSINAEAQITLI